LSSGTERVWLAPSAPSKSSHLAPACTPASSSSHDSGTPVHCAPDSSPWVCWTVVEAFFSQSVSPFPEHSMKWNLETAGYRIRLSMVKTSGCRTMPWMTSLCVAGSMSGVPAWCRS
jgi:hypothetical protein